MRFRHGRAKRDSIVFKISRIVTMVLILVIVLLVSYNLYSFFASSRNAREQQQRVMRIHSGQMAAVFSAATTTLDELALDNLGPISTLPNVTAFRRYVASVDLAGLLSTKVDRNPRLACLYFLYDELDVLLARYSGTLDWKQKFSIEDHLRASGGMDNDALSGGWHALELGGEWFLLQNYRIGPADLGVLIRAKELLKGVPGEGAMQSVYLLTDPDGQILASENTGAFGVGERIDNAQGLSAAGTCVLFTEELPKYGLRLSCAVPSDKMYAGIGTIQYLLCGMGAVVILAVLAISRYLSRNVVDPLKELERAARELEKGNIEYRIPAGPAYAREFSDLMLLFNNMTQEIKTLKIQNYEEALERKNAELKYLQLQLHPHFYLNAITTISSLSMRGENAQIQRFIEALSTYLRYLFTDNQSSATIETEIRHAEDYIHLQQISHADNIFYYISVDPRVAEVPLQKLLVQTFVENIFKHAFDGETSISVFIRASLADRDGGRFARVTVEDTGCGFPQELLDRLAAADGVENVGIYNVCRSLEYAYGRGDLIHLSNNEQGGARVVIDIPLDAPDTREKEAPRESSDR